MKRSIVVIGAGPAGLAAGIAAAQCGHHVTVLERNNTAGKKLLLSGQGQCNVTHSGSVSDFLTHYGSAQQGRFVRPALYHFDNEAVMRFFADAGVPLWIRRDGKVFPKSMQAKDILNALLRKLGQSGGQLVTNTCVQCAEKGNDGFRIETNSGTVTADSLIIAAGGQSYPATGSDGNGYRLAESFGHRIVTVKPALTAVSVRDYAFSESAGTAFADIPFQIVHNGKVSAKRCGSVLLTHTGLSGPGILDASRLIESGDIIRLQLIPPEKLSPDLYSGKRTLKNVLQTLGLPETFLLQLFRLLDIPVTQAAAETNRLQRQRLESALTRCTFSVQQCGTWHEAMATAGGVDLTEVERQTLESRLVRGLYFCGEVLDIDGSTGGYNIQFALSSGFLIR
ncbi:MAG: aminoacetone oxidase family FAD-binding enzyme [Planctomycetaceae bacterium]|nr:aminoacetone oxidase family FAD-binding enzyme [Planctomycetaceae bacterium]